MDSKVINWLTQGDPAIRWQSMRDLQGKSPEVYEAERAKTITAGWGAKLLELQDADGKWSGALYSPKWISTTYTMLLLKRFGLPGGNSQLSKACKILLDKGFYTDGGINYFKVLNHSETCVTGMILGILSYFGYEDTRLETIADWLLDQQMRDGGWNCKSFEGATHSSLHTTISVLEGLRDFTNFNTYKSSPIKKAIERGCEFILLHKLYISDRTGEIIDPKFTRFSFPPRWRYDILRGLDYFCSIDLKYDARMDNALELVLKKRTSDGMWKLQNNHHGRVYFSLEEAGKPSRWNTLRALRILNKYCV